MRISDWSSDVCSSDLLGRHRVFDNIPQPVRNSSERVFSCPEVHMRLYPLFRLFALPVIAIVESLAAYAGSLARYFADVLISWKWISDTRLEEHTSDLQSILRI